MIKLSQIFHAGHIISEGETRIAFDPVLRNRFSELSYAFPQVRFDYSRLKKQRFSAVFISHVHFDHFDLKSLALLDRETPIYLFSSVPMYEIYLGLLGFKSVRRISGNQSIRVGSLTVETVDNAHFSFESGYLVRHGDVKILNMVDCLHTRRTFARLNERGPFDLVLFPFQIPGELSLWNTSSSKNLDRGYFENLKRAAKIRSKNLVLGACQFDFGPGDWRNHHNYPVSREGFSEDLKKMGAEKNIVPLQPGECLAVGKNRVKKLTERLDFLRAKEPFRDYEWNPMTAPSRPPLPVASPGVAALAREHLNRFFAKEMKNHLRQERFASLLGSGSVWKITVRYSSRKEEVIAYRLGPKKTVRLPNAKNANIFSEIDAALIVDMMTGKLCENDFILRGGLRHGGFFFGSVTDAKSQDFNYSRCPLTTYLCQEGVPAYYSRLVKSLL